MEYALAVCCGALVGCALGLTGGGGSVLAVPILVYVLSVPANEAVGVSLAAVGATAAAGLVQRLWRREVELVAGLSFALAAMLGAPLGTWLNALVAPAALIGMFAVVMLVVAGSMWLKADHRGPERLELVASSPASVPPTGRAVKPGRPNQPRTNGPLLLLAGGLVGVFSGLFGVGGGFVIVPALVLLGGLDMHSAVATSLLVIPLVSITGIASYLLLGRAIDFKLVGLFVFGGVVGMWLGVRMSRRISGPTLQKSFAVAIIAIAISVIIKLASGAGS